MKSSNHVGKLKNVLMYCQLIDVGPNDIMLADRRPAKHRQRATRPHSPYSTDSNYSAAPAAASRPRRPYPKSERRRQLMGASGGSGDSSGEHRRLAGNNSPQTDRLRASSAGQQFTRGTVKTCSCISAQLLCHASVN